MTEARPKSIAGGCLCGSVRYTISFEDAESWPPMVATCQCTMCRKWTGSLFSTDLVVQEAQISPDLNSFDTFSKYQSSTGVSRAFCSKCGSSIAWYGNTMPGSVIIFVGTIDEEFLVGKVEEDTKEESNHGTEFKRGTAYGKALTDASAAGNLYWQNVILGATDHLRGPKFLQTFVGASPLPDD